MSKKALSVDVSGTLTADDTPVRRNTKTKDFLVTQPFEGIDTVADVLFYAARTHGTKDAFGTREVMDVHEEEKEVRRKVNGEERVEKKKWKYFELGPYGYLSFREVKSVAVEIANAFVELGLKKGDVFNIYAQTSANWQLVQHACNMISTTIATAYDTLGESGLKHALNEPECVGLFTNADLLQTLLNILPEVPTVKLVVYDGKPKAEQLDKLRGIREGIRVMSLEEVRAMGRGKDESGIKGRLPGRDDLACIMYTSGSTGAPKGVLLTHLNLISACGAIHHHNIGSHLHADDFFLSFLPLSHILAYIVDLTLFFMGCTIGYGRVRTLTDASVRKCKGDIREFRPTIMIGVPAVWEMIRKGIVGKVNAGGAVTKGVFGAAIKLKRMDVGVVNRVVDGTVLGAVKSQTGGRLRMALCGGAALSLETQEFLNLALVKLLQGYGLTESCGMCAILGPDDFKYGIAGTPVGSIEIKLHSVPDAGYLATNTPPQGEIWIRGPSVTIGYFKRPDLNNDKNIFTEDGWFRTGDVGQWNADGSMSIIDRIKNLVKLSGGEYIALERLESVYKSSPLVSNLCVHGDTNAKQPIAIIIPHEGNLRHALKTSSTADLPAHNADLHEICASKAVEKMVLDSCNAAGKKSQFKGMEMLQAVILTADEWTPENELVTAAQKIQRKKIAGKFEREIKEAYKNSQGE